MATLPVYTTFVAGTILTAAQLNTQVVNAGNFWLNPPYADLYNAAGVTCGTSATYFLVPWDTEIEDSDNMHSTVTNPSRVICVTPGVYHIEHSTSWASNATGFRGSQFRLNSAGAVGTGTQLQFAFGLSIGAAAWGGGPRISWYYRFANIGDYMETFVDQTSGGSLVMTGGTIFNQYQCMWRKA